ncbi:unnamed protein product [Paramecium sonneborni]|uniref:Uncharacterized protein n=1 Tax=Paramecium sonneborni TaxID=65129 RepID=A0A8S1RGJ2_9CILI|nr:unnamed protein product [Paramecium sonneborni]
MCEQIQQQINQITVLRKTNKQNEEIHTHYQQLLNTQKIEEILY